MSTKLHNKPRRQRALVLGGGGSLGAYEAGVLKVLCKKLREQDKEKREEDRLLFDIVAGTSIDAMNGAVLVSQFLQRGNWEDAIENLQEFWTERLSSKPDISELQKPWYDEWKKKNSTAATEEAARRYFSVKKLLRNGAPNVYSVSCLIDDDRFFDSLFLNSAPNFFSNVWYLHISKPLQESIEKYATFPIATSYNENQPRLLVFSVDVAEGQTVTFDSYPKADGFRKSQYGEYIKEEGYENVIEYDDGIDIKHVMASGTIPEFYDYREIDGHKFWDGGLLSNTPFRELLLAHEQYWTDMHENKRGKVPDLEVYIINLHPPKQPNPPSDHDGVKDRINDITFFDRNSHYDEKVANLVVDYKNFVNNLKNITAYAISKANKAEKSKLRKRLKDILTSTAISKDSKGEYRRYRDLIKHRFELTKVVRIEYTNYVNSILGKTGDFTSDTVKRLIKEGQVDAWVLLIQNDIKGMKLPPSSDKDIKHNLIDQLTKLSNSLKQKDFQNISDGYDEITAMIDDVNNKRRLIDKVRTSRSDKIISSLKAFKVSLTAM